jgi:hypothetical protein
LVTEAQLGAVEAFLRKSNPTAEVVRTEHSVLAPATLLGTARFSMDKAEEHPQWLAEAREHEHTPETLEYGISSFVFRAKRPFHPERLYAALGQRPREGALGALLRLKGFAWHATRPDQQAHAALAGTQFTMAPGPPWLAAIPRHLWPEGLADQLQAEEAVEAEAELERNPTGASRVSMWDAEHGDRRTELVCIGRELDGEAAQAQLEACLLTADEMAGGAESWRALADPFAPAWGEAARMGGGGAHEHGAAEGIAEQVDAIERLASAVTSGATEASLRGILELVTYHGVPTDDLIALIFETLLSEGAVKQIKECAWLLRGLFDASTDKRRTQRAVLKGVTSLVTKAAQGEAMLKKTPALLMVLCAEAPAPHPPHPRLPHGLYRAGSRGGATPRRTPDPYPTPAGTTSTSSRRRKSSSGTRTPLAKRMMRVGRFVRRPRRSSSGFGRQRRSRLLARRAGRLTPAEAMVSRLAALPCRIGGRIGGRSAASLSPHAL